MNRDTIQKAQTVMAATGAYTGALDGYYGAKTAEAVEATLRKYAPDFPGKVSSRSRRLVAAMQALLENAGYEPGAIDGYVGHNTENAYAAFLLKTQTGRDLVVDRSPIRRDAPTSTKFPLQRDCKAFYGAPGKGNSEVARQLISVPTYDMRIDWALQKHTRSIQLHRKCADSAEQAFRDIAEAYGPERLRELGLDRFAGSYNPRQMRGGKAWSMHAYGCAIDFYAQPNGLTMRCPDALFCGEEYVTFFDIWESHGWISLGREIGRDWMHVQAARLR